MSDETPLEPSAELAAEVEAAVANGSFPDAEVPHMLEMVLLGMKAVGADALYEHWVAELPDIGGELTEKVLDDLRDWVVVAGEGLQEFLKVHGLTKLRLPLCHLSCGHVRSLTLVAG